MEFFDRKEEVLDIQLTRHGKRKLAQGEFKPAYYSFHDDGILYDPNWAEFDEETVQAEDRITEKTAYVKPQSLFSEAGQKKDKTKVTRPEESVITTNKLGTADIKGDEAPAVHLEFLQSEIDSVTGSSGSLPENVQQIPQVNLGTIEYQVDIVDSPETFNAPDAGQFGEPDSGILNQRFPDGSKVKVQEEKILLAVDEENAPFKDNNFEIEIFEVDEKSDDERVLKKKEFRRSSHDEAFQELFTPQENVAEQPIDTGSVEYFLDINVDEEINRRELCRKLGDVQKDIFQSELECGDISPNVGISSDPDEGPYSSDVDPEDTEDKC